MTSGLASGIWMGWRGVLICMKNIKALSIASLDLEKAFDNVKHGFIIKCLNETGLPNAKVEYLLYVYSNAKTILSFNGYSSDPLHTSQGVR